MMRKCVWIGVAFLAVICGVEGIKCWVCQSDIDPRCADPFDNSTIPITDCDMATLVQFPSLKSTMCRKIKQTVNGDLRIIRSCAFLGSSDEGAGNGNHCPITGTSNVFMETCTCNNEDLCNSATSVELSQLAVFLTALLLFQIKFLQVG